MIDAARLEIERPMHCRYGAGMLAACEARIRASVFGACAAGWIVSESRGVYIALCPDHIAFVAPSQAALHGHGN